MPDFIDRALAQTELMLLAKDIKVNVGDTEVWRGVYIDPAKAYQVLRELPSVDAVPTWFHDKCMQEEIKKRFGMEEVVRCKDCNHYDDGLCRRWKWSHVTDEDSFCSSAERREEKDEG